MQDRLIPAANLRRMAAAITAAAGSEAAEAEAVADNLVDANLAGHDSHGVGMLPTYVAAVHAGQLVPNRHARIVSQRGPVLIVDGGLGYGQVIGREAMDAGIAAARANGVAAVAIRDSHHLGRIGAWAEQCAEAGLASMHYVNGTGRRGTVAPFGGSDGRMATNPYCAGAPSADGRHVILDMATSRVAMGKVRVARNKSKPIAEGNVIDAQGRPTTDPRVMYSEPRGALVPFGEHKGYGLAAICELFAGALTAGGTIVTGVPRPLGVINNMLSVIIDPGAFGDAGAFHREVAGLADWLKSSPPAPGAEVVLVAGDPERRHRAERGRNGIPVDAGTLAELAETARALGLSVSSLIGGFN